MKRVLVTGATGFVGRQVAPLLEERGYDVHRAGSREADLLDPAQADELVRQARPSHLLHLAWYAEPGKFWSAPENADWLEASMRLLQAFAEAGGSRAVIAGSCAEYDWTGSGRLSERETPLRPATLYGTSKNELRARGEELAASRGMSIGWGRVFFLYGPHEPPGRLVSQVASALVRGEPAPTSEGGQRRDFLHVRDVASAFGALLDSAVEGPVNIGSGAAVPVREVVSLIAKAAGHPELVRWGEVPARPGEPQVLEADVARLRDEVGWAPSVPLEEGIRETVEWWRGASG